MSKSHTTNSEQDEQRDIASLTLLQLLSQLKLSQVWVILTVIFSVLAGSFGLGYKLSDIVIRSEVERASTENASLQDRIKQFRAIQTKERFLALYLRYLTAKSAFSADASNENQNAVEQAGANLQSYIQELLQRGEEASDEIDLRGLFLGKSAGREAMVKFGYDGSVWPVPPEFGFASAE